MKLSELNDQEIAHLEARLRDKDEVVDDLVVTNADKAQLAQIAHRELQLVGMPSMATEPGESGLYRRGRERAFVKVQDGCRYRCTYCIVPRTRGREVCRPMDELLGALEADFVGHEAVRQMCIHAPKYGNNDPVVDQTASLRRLETGAHCAQRFQSATTAFDPTSPPRTGLRNRPTCVLRPGGRTLPLPDVRRSLFRKTYRHPAQAAR